MKIYSGYYHVELEEVEYLDDYLLIEFDIYYTISPEEPMVRYYPDGSGYPGSPLEIELSNPTNIKISGCEGNMDQQIFFSMNILDRYRDYIEDKILESYND